MTRLSAGRLGALGAALLLLGGGLVWRVASGGAKVALAPAAKPVTLVQARASSFQPTRTYVGTLQPWLSAAVGPQLVSAYVDTVLVRPGVAVKRGEVLATLDCRNASAGNQAVAGAARAVAARQKALAGESDRVQGLLAGHFVSPNEADKKAAASAAEGAELSAMTARLSRSALEVNDCVLRAPFDGDVSGRTLDPGAFVRPGTTLVSVVDRSTVRLVADVPENDFALVSPGTRVRIVIDASRLELAGVVSRRAPAADPSTRTIHFEVDLADPARQIPVGTTGEVHLDVGPPEPATEIPLAAASVRGRKATVFVVEGDAARARTVAIKGESGGSLFVDASLADGAQVVTEGRALLTDGERVSPAPPRSPGSALCGGMGSPHRGPERRAPPR